jgi:hypothetical protein
VKNKRETVPIDAVIFGSKAESLEEGENPTTKTTFIYT